MFKNAKTTAVVCRPALLLTGGMAGWVCSGFGGMMLLSFPAPALAQAAAPTFDDHQNMMEQLGVKKLRPGPDPNNQSTFDEATANPTSGIIGLMNKGQPRKPDDWGALWAWQWGVSRLIDYFETHPDSLVDATKILTALFPRNDNLAAIPTTNRINDNLAQFADGKKVRYLNVNDKLADKDGKFFAGKSRDNLHPTVKGYQVWADGLKPIFTELLGPPAKTDHAPPPTGDPSASGGSGATSAK